jgi:serine/threonine protein kinase
MACPSLEQLRRLLAEQVDEVDQAALESHLETCAACQQTLEVLTPVSERWQRPERRPPQGSAEAAFLHGLAEGPAASDCLSDARAETASARTAPAGYEILQELGRGASGVVYKARHLQSNRLVALKVLKSRAGNSLARFRREVEALIWLQHPQLVRVYEVGQHQSRPYFAMELVEGTSLAKTLAQGPMPPWSAARLLATLARGVQAAHENGLVHRDLKPANVLLASDGQPKIVDFGLAKSVAGDRPVTSLGAVIGTPGYMAPEQARGQDLGPAADIYALGAIFYQALTGQPPFTGTTVRHLLVQVRRASPISPRQLRPDVPVKLEQICLRCLLKAPKFRPASARELAVELESFLSTSPEPPLPSPATVVPAAVQRPRRRRSRVLTLLAGPALAVSMVLAMVAWFPRPVDQPRTSEPNAAAVLSARPSSVIAAEALAKASALPTDDLPLKQPGDPVPQHRRPPEECPAPRLIPAPRPEKLVTWHKSRRLTAQGPVRALAFAPDASVVAWGASQWVQAWDLELGKSRFNVVGHSAAVNSLVFAPDGSSLLSAAVDGTLRIHDPTNGTVRQRFDPPKQKPNAALLSRDGTVALVSSHWLRLREIRTERQLGESSTDGSFTCMAFAPEGGLLAAAGVDPAPQPPAQVKKGKGKATGLQPAPEEPERWIRLLDAQTGERQRSLSQLKTILCLTFAPDGKVLAAGGQGPTILVWKTAGRAETYELETRAGWVTSLAFSPDGRLLAAGSSGGTVEVWDWVASKRLQALNGHTATILAVAFAPDGQTMVSGCADGTVCFWKPAEDR